MTAGGESGMGVAGESARPAIDSYNSFVAAHPDLAAQSQDLLYRLSMERDLTFGGTPFCRYLRPHLISPGQHSAIVSVVSRLASAFVRLRRAIMQDTALMDQLDLTPEERRLVFVDPGFEEPSPSARFDSFWSEHDWKFVENNAESPASISYSEVLGETFLELPIIREWMAAGGYRIIPIPSRYRFLQELEKVWAEFRGNRAGTQEFPEKPNIGIIDWAGVPTESEFRQFKAYFEGKGYPTVIATPESLQFRDGRLYAGDFRIDMYYKRVLTSELLSRPDVAKTTLEAYEAGAVCIVNSFRAKLLHKKMSLALLHDDANAHLFSPDEVEAIRAHIPWTRKVTEGYTTYNGERVETVPFIAENRANLVIKPNDEYGGKGVVIGWETSEERWMATLREALEDSYVAQWAVKLEREPYPFYADGKVQIEDLAADLDPYVFGTDTRGMLTRLASVALLNVTAGTGSVVPTMVVEKE